jgi:xanthine dehydrogenase accessory factor
MTHDHDLDYRIVRALLVDGRFAWLGLIGSETKATCFRIRLAREGVADDRILRMVSPIGLEGLRGKAPSTIAISVAAQLIERLPLGQR